MIRQYLTRPLSVLEIVAAAYAALFGPWVWALAQRRPEVLDWAGLHGQTAIGFCVFMTACGLIHGTGIRVNGRWRWSPVLRAAGMAGHVVAFGWLAFWGNVGFSTAGFTYLWPLAACLFGFVNASRDVRAALARWVHA